MARWLSLGMFRRVHPVRCIRYGLFLVLVGILLTSVWQYVSSTSEKPHKHSHEPKEDLADPSIVNNDHDVPPKRHKYDQKKPDHRRGHHSVSAGLPDDKKHDRKAQALLDYIGDNLFVRYTVAGNEGGRYFIDLTLANNGTKPIDSCCWSIYFYHSKFLDTYSFNSGMQIRMMSENSKQVSTEELIFKMSHVNGYTFRLQPTNWFSGLEPGEHVVLRLTGGGWAVSKSQIIPNWYVANDYAPTEPRLLQSTVGEDLKFVGTFDPKKKWVRSDDDACVPFTPEDRYSRNKVRDMGGVSNTILPTPLSTQFKNDGKMLSLEGSEWVVQYVPDLENEAKYIQEKLNISSIQAVEIPKSTGKAQCRPHTITLHLSDNMPKTAASSFTTPEKYILVIGTRKDCISVFGPSPVGVFWGLVSLVSLSSPTNLGRHSFPGVVMADAARYSYRGVMVDVVRHFHTKEEMIKLMEAMSMYKLNKLHLHLADDEGWRLEIPGLEELTTFGGQRGHDLKEKSHIMSLLGSGPFTNSSGSGFYTVDDYRDILQFAASHHIEVIPEFDMPGHSHAAIKSMEARYARLKAQGDEDEAMKYLLSDLADRSVYSSGQFYKDSAINPCIESSYRFVDHVVREVIKIYKDVMPLKHFHFGGDEVPQEAYTASPACVEFLHHHKKLSSTKDLKTYFVRRVALIVARYGLSAMGWEDAFTMSHGLPLPVRDLGSEEVISQAWYNIWESGLAHRAYQYANSGYKVVLAPTTNFYYDNPQEPDPEDWGLHWATRYVSTKRSFNFMPDSMYDSMDFDFWGRPVSKKELCDMHQVMCEPLRVPENILGIEGVMWSELIRTPDRMDWMLWPRLLALAERSWHKASWESIDSIQQRLSVRKEDWMKFANLLGYKELRRLENIGVSYYLPRPGARIRKGKLWVNIAFPGLVVQVSTDDGRTWNDYDVNADYRGHLLLATRSFSGNRRSVPVAVIMND